MKAPEAAAFLRDSDESVVLEAARAIHDAPIDAAMPALAGLASAASSKNPRILERVINANYRLGKPEHAVALSKLAADERFPEGSRKDALDALANWGTPDAKDRVLNLWRPLPDRPGTDAATAVSAELSALLQKGPAGLQEAAAKLAGKLSIASSGEALAQLASNDQADAGARVAALQALATLKDARLGEASKKAMQANDARVRGEALQALARADAGAAVAMISGLIEKGSPQEKQAALLALSQLKDPAATAQIAGLMEKLIAGKVAPEIQLDLYEAAKKAGLSDLVAKYKASLPANDPLAPYRLSLAGGDAERGKKLFREHQQAQCIKCHKLDGGDSVVGPDLTKIGAQKDRAYLLESIVFPNRTIAQGFQLVSLILKNGGAVGGKLIGEDPGSIKVETVGSDGKPQVVSVAPGDVKDRISAPSPMPENLREVLSRAELRDLVEYLATRK